MTPFQPLEWIWNDVRHAWRGLRRSVVFTAVAVGSLALGIGANTAIFSFVNAILLKQLPVPAPERLVTFAESYRGQTTARVWPISRINDLAQRGTAFDGVAGWFARPVQFSTGDTGQWVVGELVTGQFYRTLAVKPAIGRLLGEADVRDARTDPVCVLSYGLWQRQFNGEAGVIGRRVFLNGQAYRVAGVTERGFSGAELHHQFDVAAPATRIGDFMPAFSASTGVDWLNGLSWLRPIARLQPGISRAQAEAQTQAWYRQTDAKRTGALRLEDGSQGFNAMRGFGQPVLVLMGVAGLVLLVACANLANLLLARSQGRSWEFAVRLSIGASRGRLVRQLLAESLLLAAGGGAAGIALAFWMDRMLAAVLNEGKTVAGMVHVAPDLSVLAFSVVLSAATAVLFGLAPAWQATRPELFAGLKPEASGQRRTRMRRSLAAAQVALSLMIVFAAGLLTRTLRGLETVDRGFQPERVIALNTDPAADGHSSLEVARIFDDMLARARALSGVAAASLAASTPNGPMVLSMGVEVPGYTPKSPRDTIVDFNFVSPGYFKTVGEGIFRGRDFDARDRQNGPRVAIVNQKFVRHFFEGRDPVGRKLRQGGGDVEIVGVVADVRDGAVRQEPIETVFLPEKQGQTSGLTVLVRTASDPRPTIPRLVNVVRGVDAHLPIVSVQTLETQIQSGLINERILGYLSALFAALATLLAGIGLYGVMAYAVAQRTREIGVRFAVGAQRRDVTVLFARESLTVLAAGLVIGAPAALAAAQVFRALLFGVGPGDPLTLVLSAVALAATAVLATALPLRRAAGVDPAIALRYE